MKRAEKALMKTENNALTLYTAAKDNSKKAEIACMEVLMNVKKADVDRRANFWLSSVIRATVMRCLQVG